MACVSGLNEGVSVKSEIEIDEGFGVDELDHIPLKERLKMLCESKVESRCGVLERESKGNKMSPQPINLSIKEEEADCPSKDVVLGYPGLCFSVEGKDGRFSQEQSHTDGILERSSDEVLNIANNVKSDVVGLEKVEVNVQHLPQHPTLSTFPSRVKVEDSDYDLMSPCRDNTNANAHAIVEADELDHIPLKERQMMLLSRKSIVIAEQLIKKNIVTAEQLHISGILQGVSVGQSACLKDDTNQHSVRKVEEGSHLVEKLYSVDGNDSHGIPKTNDSQQFGTSEFDSSSSDIAGMSSIIPQCSPKSIVATGPNNMLGSSSLPTFPVKVMVETLENGLESPRKNSLGSFINNNVMLPVKAEVGISDKFYEDELDHMPLQQRIMLLMSRKDFNIDYSRNLKCLQRPVPLSIEYDVSVSKSAKPRGINCRRKRKTATDSVETALEEDAPGLLQVLIDNGITIDEIKLYGNMESEDALDISSNENSFVDLENVISKLFSPRASVLKFAPLRCMKGLKPSYCLACLISLVEQTRYLQFRKWPVQWGWCRDLQSFIFVFERHNRIVLERPEYGYATYFFELVDSLPIDWQIKRLVIAMKLSGSSRVTLIENRSLLVGEDLTIGEAKVLEEYGWTPNTGLGSMLNYCDRVIHDRQKENDGSEWRSKIGKLLVNGYNGGTFVLQELPKKVIEYKSTESPQIKLEL